MVAGLELRVGVNRIAHDLSEQLNEQMSVNMVHQWRARFRAEPDLQSDVDDRHLLPVGHPERRPTPFVIE